jgi:hypothetical protein
MLKSLIKVTQREIKRERERVCVWKKERTKERDCEPKQSLSLPLSLSLSSLYLSRTDSVEFDVTGGVAVVFSAAAIKGRESARRKKKWAHEKRTVLLASPLSFSPLIVAEISAKEREGESVLVKVSYTGKQREERKKGGKIERGEKREIENLLKVKLRQKERERERERRGETIEERKRERERERKELLRMRLLQRQPS